VKLFRWGGDCYAYGLLASGHVDLVVENSLKLYDFAALVPVIKGAGGLITDWQGRELDMQSDGSVAGGGRRRDPSRCSGGAGSGLVGPALTGDVEPHRVCLAIDDVLAISET